MFRRGPSQNSLLVGSSFNVILRLIRNVDDCAEKGLYHILFGVHHIDVVRKFEALEIGKLREGGNVSPVVRLTISLEAFAFDFRLESF